MKIILLEDVKNVGKRGEVAEVKDGYAINFLMPRNLAAESSAGALARLQAQNRAKQRREAEAKADAEKLAVILETTPLTVAVKSGGNGRLFGTVTNADVAEAIQREFSFEVDRHKIEMPESIKSLGTYQIVVRLGKNISAKAALKVVPTPA